MAKKFLIKPIVRSVALVGMDGSGKTTQAKNLCLFLKEYERQVIWIHPFGWKMFPFLSSYNLQKPRQSARAEQERASAKSRTVEVVVSCADILDKVLYLWLAYLRCFFTGLFLQEQVWLVSDRSFDDLLTKHLRRSTLPAALLMALRGFVPQPDRTVWLQTEPLTAQARDGEFPSTYYTELDQRYAAFAKRFGWLIIPTTDRSREAILSDILEALDLLARVDSEHPGMQPTIVSPAQVDILSSK